MNELVFHPVFLYWKRSDEGVTKERPQGVPISSCRGRLQVEMIPPVAECWSVAIPFQPADYLDGQSSFSTRTQ